ETVGHLVFQFGLQRVIAALAEGARKRSASEIGERHATALCSSASSNGGWEHGPRRAALRRTDAGRKELGDVLITHVNLQVGGTCVDIRGLGSQRRRDRVLECEVATVGTWR